MQQQLPLQVRSTSTHAAARVPTFFRSLNLTTTLALRNYIFCCFTLYWPVDRTDVYQGNPWKAYVFLILCHRINSREVLLTESRFKEWRLKASIFVIDHRFGKYRFLNKKNNKLPNEFLSKVNPDWHFTTAGRRWWKSRDLFSLCLSSLPLVQISWSYAGKCDAKFLIRSF